jgi:hypothetical protein
MQSDRPWSKHRTQWKRPSSEGLDHQTGQLTARAAEAAAIAATTTAAAAVTATTTPVATAAAAAKATAAFTGTTETTATAATTATATTGRLLASFVDHQATTLHLKTIEGFDRCLRLIRVVHGHKTKATRTAGFLIHHNTSILNGTVYVKHFEQLRIGCAPRQIAYINLHPTILEPDQTKQHFKATGFQYTTKRTPYITGFV